MPHEIFSSLVVSPTNTNQFVLKKDFVYETLNGETIVVPEGYITRGGDKRKSYWSYDQNAMPLTLPAMIVHDYYSSIGEPIKGEELMKEILNLHHTPITVRIIYG